MERVFYIVDALYYFQETDNSEVTLNCMEQAITWVRNVIIMDKDYGDADNTICIIDMENMKTVFLTTETVKTRTVNFKVKE